MSEVDFLELAKKIMKAVFNRDVDMTLEEIEERFSYDVVLPKEVKDTISGEVTYVAADNSKKYITNDNMEKRDREIGWIIDKRDVKSLSEIIEIWEETNYLTTERNYDCINVVKSDTIYNSQNVYKSMDSSKSKGLIFCNSCHESENLIASSRSVNSSNSIRCDDSQNSSNSFGVICSNKIINSLFIQDCFDLYECMFCSHIASQKYMIANMQFSEKEYFRIKEKVVDWILGEKK